MSKVNQAKEIQMVSIDEIMPNVKNRNKHPKEQIERLKEIIEYSGFRAPLVVSNQTGQLVVGHGRLIAARQLGFKELPVIYQDFDSPEQEYQHAVADNAIGLWSELDMPNINVDLGDLGPDFNIDLLGIKGFELEPADKLADAPEDIVGGIPSQPKTKIGDLFILGAHRLLCGDSSDILQVQKLLEGEKPDLVFTDPPYGINVVGQNGEIGGGHRKTGKKNFRQIIGDDAEFDANICFGYCEKVVLFGGNYFAHTLPKSGRWMVWQKKLFDSDRTLSDCELIWTSLEGVMVKSYQHVWDGYFRSGTKKDELNSRVHPTQKPVALLEKMLNDLGETKILDLFGGSGSTLIACEKTKRNCFMMELDPSYCDVIINRWCKYTDEEAYLRESNGNEIEWSKLSR